MTGPEDTADTRQTLVLPLWGLQLTAGGRYWELCLVLEKRPRVL